MRFIAFIILLTLFALSSLGQRSKNWHFGMNAGIRFNDTGIALIPSALVAQRATSSMSDEQGNLLFYTNGITVWNKNNLVMANGTGLLGVDANPGVSGITNSVITLPMPSNDSLYYVIYNSYSTYNYYSIINIKKNGGLGEVVSKNIQIDTFRSYKSITATAHQSLNAFWICYETFDYNNSGDSMKFNSHLLMDTGLVISPVKSAFKTPFVNGSFGGLNLKISPNGEYISSADLVPFYFNKKPYLAKFDKEIGKITEPIFLDSVNGLSVCFSSDSKKLYISNEYFIFQFSLATYNTNLINSSKVMLTSNPIFYNGVSIPFGNMVNAPNGKIYIARHSGNFLSVIENPTATGTLCNYKDTAVVFYPNFSYWGLPNFFSNVNNEYINNISISRIGCNNYQFKFTSSLRGVTTKLWQFGDGNTSNDSIATHIFQQNLDSVLVKFTISNTDTVIQKQQWLYLPKKPVSNFSTATNGCVSDSVRFNTTSTFNTNTILTDYYWQLGDASTNTLSTFSKRYADTGSYLVKHCVKDNFGCISDTISKIISVNKKIDVGFNIVNSACEKEIIPLVSNAIGINTSINNWKYFISNGDSVVNISNGIGQYAFQNYGSYTVKHIVTSTAGCRSDTAISPVLVKAKPVADISYNNNGCINQPTNLTDNSNVANSSLQTYYWQLPSGAVFTTNAINPIFSAAGNQAIRYAVSSIQGCHSDTITKNIFIESTPLATINSPTNSCTNALVSFSNASNIALGRIDSSYWRVAGQPWQVQQGVGMYNYSFAQAGNYTVQHYVKSKHGCISNIESKPINIESKPNASFSNGIACIGRQVLFTNNSSNTNGAIVNSQWAVNGVFVINNGIANFGYSFSQAGNYTVGLRVSTANGCIDTLSKVIAVEQANAYAGADQTVLENANINLQASGGNSYLWQPPIGLSNANISNPIARLLNSQQYIVQVTTVQGCVGFDTVLITVLRNLQIPNAFSPNGDGINDEWRIDQLKDYPNAELQLYSRNGTLVYSAKGNNITAWKGSINNKPVAAGTYYYLIHLNNSLRSKPYSGWVLVVR